VIAILRVMPLLVHVFSLCLPLSELWKKLLGRSWRRFFGVTWV